MQDILPDTQGFEGDIAHQLIVGMSDGNKNKFGVSFPFEYTKLLKQKLLYFIGSRSYLSCSVKKNTTMSVPKSSVPAPVLLYVIYIIT